MASWKVGWPAFAAPLGPESVAAAGAELNKHKTITYTPDRLPMELTPSAKFDDDPDKSDKNHYQDKYD